MLSAERRRKIMEKIEEQGTVSINQLAEEFGVSAMTIRRDLDGLEKENKIVRTHGGAIARKEDPWELSHKWKDEQNAPVKEKIASVAIQMIQPGHRLILDAGSTNLRLARWMTDLKDIYVVTNDLKIALEFADVSGIKVLLTGGQLKPSVYSLDGFHAESVIENIHVDLAFIGCDAFDWEQGAMSNSLSKIKLKQTMLKSAEKRILIADASKFGKRAFSTFAPLDQFDVILTDDRIPSEFVEKCQQQGIQVICAKIGDE
ncbi:DeoR/GlpR family DNA-binding transcription regulator [Thermoflavimicrobium dichotomicum]|uniref:DeoR family transcriptional regulator, aga operon transcriptional repressor n=1 Tax=Thermoflavimicrobium dichotomicum TaxID=46223 RepID=A0A1I3V3X0_9BACL|nr:DeoR/GlpR family DNA-binding transcription regulator [Thermoflavimicrobium dichotomicum]SFJ88867.1 DeoR family transcriptional regulator, aga operon transcriptional repressor [Thermoflavimicrobium dichotomicum]